MRNFVCFTVIALLCAVGVTSCNGNRVPGNKKEIMDRFVAGTLDPSYVPAAFFIHFGSNQKTGDAAVQAHLEHLRNSDMDIMKVQFEQSMPRVRNLDAQETWDAIGPVPDEFYRPTLEVITKLQEAVGSEVYVMPTIYSPYQVARQSLTEPEIAKAAVERPEDLKRVLGYYADALVWLVKECKAAGIEGFYMCTQGGEAKFEEIPGWFTEIIRPNDLKVMNECVKDTKVNILHICDWEGPYNDLTRYADYPGQIVNTPIYIAGKPFSLQDGVKLFNRPVLGGLDRKKEIVHSSVEELTATVDAVLKAAPAGKTMLGAECTVGGASPENIRAAVSTAHHR
ncbi:MAG: hypothetical protein K6F98_04035 [Bacteroidales bacterium]|nr:hypothetical protein [Bacteroidales bacterium]